jgi:hypothetical protein
LWRSRPNQAWFDVTRSPENPTQWEFGAYPVSRGQALIITDYEFRPFKFDPVHAGDYEPLEPGKLSRCMGYTMTVNGVFPGDAQFQLDPVPSEMDRTKFRPTNSSSGLLTQLQDYTVGDFARAAATSFGLVAGVGTAILPQRRERFGPGGERPWAIYAQQTEIVSLMGIVYRPVQIPVACVEARLVGYTINHTDFSIMIAELEKSAGSV